MNILAIETDTAWNRGITYIFFKTRIQLYLLRSFLYYLTYCIKEVIKGRIFWRLNQKVPAYEAATAWNRGIPSKIFKKLIQLYLFCLFSIFDLLYQRGYQRQFFWTLNIKVLAYEEATAWNRRIPCKILKFLIKLYLFCLLIYCST